MITKNQRRSILHAFKAIANARKQDLSLEAYYVYEDEVIMDLCNELDILEEE